MPKRFRRAIQALLVSAIVLVELVPAFSDAPVVVAVVLSREAAPYRQALRGFVAGAERLQQDYSTALPHHSLHFVEPVIQPLLRALRHPNR